MSYVTERDGLAACPDDFARTGSPDDGMTAAEETQFAAKKKFYTYCTNQNVKETLTGRMSSAVVICGDLLHHFPAKDIAEVLHGALTYDDIAILLAGYIDPAANVKAKAMVEKLIADLAALTGDRLAEVAMRSEGHAQ